MAAITFPLSTAPGQHPQESAGRLVNCFAEPLGKEAAYQAVFKRSPGLSAFGTTPEASGFRGMLLVGNTLYGAVNDSVYRWTSAGGAGVLVGALVGAAKCFWARNNKAPTADVVVVSPGDGAFVVTSGSVSAYPDADLPSPNSVCFLDGYLFFTIGDARCFATGLNTTDVNSIDFTTAEAKTDTLLRAIPFNGQLYLCGSGSIEVYANTANPTGFPFTRLQIINRGLASPYAIAGHEDGFGGPIVFVGDDNAVHVLNGYTPEKVSPPDLDRLIAAVADKTELEASVFVANGYRCFALSCAAWTWVLVLNAMKWHERESYLITRWRATQAHNAFGKWLCGDTASGNIVAIDPAARSETGNPLRMRMESAPVSKFPARQRVPRADFDVTRGTGIATGDDPNETDPTVEISWSDDLGVSWSTPLQRKIGRQGVTRNRVTVMRAGMTREAGRRWRLDYSDGAYIGVFGGQQVEELRG